jgi:hypothetical protein
MNFPRGRAQSSLGNNELSYREGLKFPKEMTTSFGSNELSPKEIPNSKSFTTIIIPCSFLIYVCYLSLKRY